MKYIIDGSETFYDIDEVIEYIFKNYEPNATEDDFEDWVNDLYGNVEVADHIYTSYEVISNVDDTLYGQLKDRFYEDREETDRDEAEYDLNKAADGDQLDILGHTVDVSDEPTGDYDGDEILKVIDDARKSIEDKALANIAAEKESKQTADDIMKLFQAV